MQIEKALINMIAYVFQKYAENFTFQLFWSNFPEKFPLFLLSFLFINKILRLNNLKTRTVMNAKISVFVICVKAIMSLILKWRNNNRDTKYYIENIYHQSPYLFNQIPGEFQVQKQPPVVLFKLLKGSYIHMKISVLKSLFNKFICLQVCNFTKKRLQHRRFPVNIADFKNTYFEKHLRATDSDSSYILHTKLNKIIQEADWPSRLAFCFSRNIKSPYFTYSHSYSFVLSLTVIHWHSLSFFVTRCHSLSFVVSCCTTRCDSLNLSLPFVVPLDNTRCHSLPFVVPFVVTRCHSLSFDVT